MQTASETQPQNGWDCWIRSYLQSEPWNIVRSGPGKGFFSTRYSSRYPVIVFPVIFRNIRQQIPASDENPGRYLWGNLWLYVHLLPYKRFHLRLWYQRLISLNISGLRIFGAAFLPHAGYHAWPHTGNPKDLLGGTASAVELHGAFAVAVNTALA